MIEKSLFALTMLLTLMGCATGVKHDYLSATPTLTARGTGALAVGIHDQRTSVVSGNRKVSWVGESRGGYGNPFGVQTLSGNAFADDFSVVVTRALSGKGYDATSVNIAPTASHEEAKAALFRVGHDKLLLITLNRWKSDTYQAVRLFYNITAEVFGSDAQSLATKELEFTGRLGGGGMNPPSRSREYVPIAYQRAIESLLNDEEIVEALEKESVVPTNEARISDAAKSSTPSQESSAERDDTIVGAVATNEQDGAHQETIPVSLPEEEPLSTSSSDEAGASAYGYLRWEYEAQSSSDIVIALISTSLEFDEKVRRGDSQVLKARSGEHDILIHDVANGRRDKPNWQDYSFKVDLAPLTITRILITVNDRKSDSALVVTVLSDGQEIMRRTIEAD